MTRRAVVIGAGAAGLVAARELRRTGFAVTLLEQADHVGGIWAYTPATDDNSNNQRVYSSIYASLRTNLPRDLMAYSDYTFDAAGGGADDLPRYPHHTAVLRYLENFAEDFDLVGNIRFGAQVTAVMSAGPGHWTVRYADLTGRHTNEINVNTVVVCNGHYSVPRIPALPGLEHFAGSITHSHNYRTPEPYRGRRVALWGASASGADISLELAGAASEVYWCGERFNNHTGDGKTRSGVGLCPAPTGFQRDGRLALQDGTSIEIDDFIYCTGYQYEYPFLGDDLVQVDDNRVYPLYRDILVPGIHQVGFIGIPFLVVPFPLFEMQAKWYCAVLDGRVSLPSTAAMLAENQRRLQALEAIGAPMRHYHKLGEAQTDYYNLLAAECGEPPLPDWFGQLANEAQQSRLADPAGFRDRPLSTRGPTRV
ncbi:MAG: FAD-dependent oxidoreductase [Pseudomonadota bacterium]